MSGREQNEIQTGSVIEHVTDWLGAYYDDELNAAMRARVEAHLVSCPGCQRELDELRRLSTLLQAAPLPFLSLSDEAFARAVAARITRPAPSRWQRGLQIAWRFAPFFLFGAWAFFQAVHWMSAALLLGLSAAPEWLAWLPSRGVLDGGPLASLLRMSLPGGLGRLALDQVGELLSFGSLALTNLVIMVVLAGLFLSWLASWWAYHRTHVPVQIQD